MCLYRYGIIFLVLNLLRMSIWLGNVVWKQNMVVLDICRLVSPWHLEAVWHITTSSICHRDEIKSLCHTATSSIGRCGKAKLVCCITTRNPWSRNINLRCWKLHNLVLIHARVNKKAFVRSCGTQKWLWCIFRMWMILVCIFDWLNFVKLLEVAPTTNVVYYSLNPTIESNEGCYRFHASFFQDTF